jgi:hypothetical protein
LNEPQRPLRLVFNATDHLGVAKPKRFACRAKNADDLSNTRNKIWSRVMEPIFGCRICGRKFPSASAVEFHTAYFNQHFANSKFDFRRSEKTPLSTSFPLDDLLAALRAKDIEHDASQIVEDLTIKGWHIHKGVSTNYSIVRSF